MNILSQQLQPLPVQTFTVQASKKYRFVDALRGWAILGVILVHTSQTFGLSSSFLYKVASNGQYGVQLFYLTSAFTLFLSFSSRKHETNATLNFFIRRFFRIAPLFYCAIAFYLWKDGFEPRYWAPDGIKWWYVLSSIFFLNGWHPASINSVVPGGWSVAVEMNFYLFIPVLYKLVNNINKSIGYTFISLVLGLISGNLILKLYAPFFPYDQQRLVYAFSTQYSLPAQASVFCLGFVLYFLFNRLEGYSPKQKLLSIMWTAIALYLMAALLAGGGFTLVPKHFLYALAFLIFSYSLALYPISFFVNPILCFIGKVSYGTYLIHFTVIDICSEYFLSFSSGKNDINFILAFFVILSISTSLAYLTFKLIEQPGQTMGKHLILWIQRVLLHE